MWSRWLFCRNHFYYWIIQIILEKAAAVPTGIPRIAICKIPIWKVDKRQGNTPKHVFAHFKVSFSHELIWYAFSYYSFGNSCIYKFHIWMASFPHKLIQHVFSNNLFGSNCNHKWHICMIYFPHELIQHVFSAYSFDSSCNHKCHICVFFFSWTDSICVFKLVLVEQL